MKLESNKKRAFGGLNLYLSYLKVERGASGNTLDAYQTDIRQLIVFLNETAHSFSDKNWSWAEISSNDIKEYIDNLDRNLYSVSTKARKIASMSSFFKFLYDENDTYAEGLERRENRRKESLKSLLLQSVQKGRM